MLFKIEKHIYVCYRIKMKIRNISKDWLWQKRMNFQGVLSESKIDIADFRSCCGLYLAMERQQNSAMLFRNGGAVSVGDGFLWHVKKSEPLNIWFSNQCQYLQRVAFVWWPRYILYIERREGGGYGFAGDGSYYHLTSLFIIFASVIIFNININIVKILML